jgi:hypothetical protein
MLQLLSAATVPLGTLMLFSRLFRRRAPAGAEPPLAEWEEQVGRRAAAQVRHRLRDLDGAEPAQAADVLGEALRRLTASQRTRVRAAASELSMTWRRPHEPADQ